MDNCVIPSPNLCTSYVLSIVSRHSSLVTRHSLLVTRHSSLVTRHSSLVTRKLLQNFRNKPMVEKPRADQLINSLHRKPKSIMLAKSLVTRHSSLVTRHSSLSHVTRHSLLVTHHSSLESLHLSHPNYCKNPKISFGRKASS